VFSTDHAVLGSWPIWKNALCRRGTAHFCCLWCSFEQTAWVTEEGHLLCKTTNY
jgi:hypothetical protein